MRNIFRLDVILKLLVALSVFMLAGCEKEQGDSGVPTDEVTIVLDVDKVSLESASIRVRHDGPTDFLWVYMNTSDLESDAAWLIENKISKDLELTGEIVANKGQNKSLTVASLEPKSYYRFICAAIDEVSGLPYGDVAEVTYRTRRDPDLFEKNDSWSISLGERTIGQADKVEYDNFVIKSEDDAPYVVLTLKDSDFMYYYNGQICPLFEDYHSSLGIEEGSSKWNQVLNTGDITWSEQRLRSGDWHVFMIGVDPDGELSGLYQTLDFTVEQEQATEEYNRWLGTWTVWDMNENNLFDIILLPSENNMWYYMAGWESTNIYGYDTFDQALMPELFYDKATGNLAFISQYVNTLITDTDAIDFYFTGTFTYGSSYVLGQDALNLRMAEAFFMKGDYSEARVEGKSFVTQGVEFPIESICYIYYYGSNLNAISMETPTLPLKLTKKQ